MSNSGNQPPATQKLLRIGQLAARTGVSAKALRLYEQLGLVMPTRHSASGYRLYGPPALQRLMRIVLLRRCGFSLAAIGDLMRQPAELPLVGVLESHRAKLQQQLANQRESLLVLQSLIESLNSTDGNPDTLLENIAMTQTLKIDLTPAEQAAFQERQEKLGAEGMAQAQREWPLLIAAVRAAMDAGTPANDSAVVELGRRWHALVQAATGGDHTVNAKLGEAWRSNPDAMAAQGMDMAMFRYVGEAMAAAGLALHR